MKQKFDLNNKEGLIYKIRKNNESLNKKVQMITSENISLKQENQNLRDKEFSLICNNSKLQKELFDVNAREEAYKFMTSKLSSIVQSQDDEIADPKEKLRTSIKEKHWGYQNVNVNKLKDKLKENEIKLTEQKEVNHQLKQYLDMVLLKLCVDN